MPPSPGFQSEVVVITGLSGAGRSLAADHLEDLGWFAIDNLPPKLVPKVVELAQAPKSSFTRVALAVGTGHHQDEVLPMLAWLRSSGARVRVLFLEAATDVLVRRFDHTRRRHPLADGDEQHLVSAIDQERQLLAPVRNEADMVLDTSALNVHELRRRLGTLFADAGSGQGVQMTVLSFGYKHGLPLDADIVFDCRFLPNPHYVEELRPLTGLHPPVSEYVLAQSTAQSFLQDAERMLGRLLPAYIDEGRAYLTVALGCTGGQHRSVAMAEQLAVVLRPLGVTPGVLHRDVHK
ncbi:RNase adapter RapZ [Streptomyces acidicola]|uniref:RNase adapter RapZ n=1 Tax=Streptomyces acidicola TaxID=2596892 RepID=A0A5N8WRG2_9ACTN|nr:RNase adapter RapZ [Streptomyces acidicola]MPY49849.1 RNase adapter RapZ [Streptomyces acidicola]